MMNKTLRHGEFESAKKLLSAYASALKRYAVTLKDGSTYIPEGAVGDLTRAINWGDDVTAFTVRQASGLKEAEIPKLEDPDIVSAYETLRDLGLYTPMELVNTLIMMPEMGLRNALLDSGSSPADLRNAFGSAKARMRNIQRDFPRKNAYLTAIRKTALVISPDEKLERATRFGESMRIMEPAVEALDRNRWQRMDRNFIYGLISHYVAGEAADTDLAIRVLEVRCCERGYAADFSGSGPELRFCPGCGGLIDMRQDTNFCPICGREIRRICPKCGNVELAGNKCSRCGRVFADEDRRINAEAKEISEMIELGNIPTAEKMFGKLKLDYPHCSLGSLESSLGAASADYRRTVSRIEEDYKRRNLNAVKRGIERAKRKYPGIRDEGTLGDYYDEACEKVAEASALCTRAQNEEPAAAMKTYILASDVCPDHPMAVRRLKDFPPDGPDGGECEIAEDRVRISFRVPAEREGMTFCIYRGNGTLPEVDANTVPLSEIAGSVYVDSAVSPGAEYYYKIYSKRWGVLSRHYTICGPAVVVFEVTDASAEPIEDGLRITYSRPSGCSRVRVFRKLKGAAGEKELVGGAGAIEDRGLKGGRTYEYLFVAEYDVAGRTERSYGTTIEAVSPEYPSPVSELGLEWMRSENGNKATWASSVPVELYTSRSAAPRYGEIMPLKALEGIAEKIVPERTFEGGCIFGELPGAVNFVTAVSVIGETAVIGASQRVVNLRPFSGIRKKGDEGACIIRAEWPDDAESAALICRDAETGEESEPISVSRAAYEREGAIAMSMGSSEMMEVSMYAVYRIDGHEVRSAPRMFTAYSGRDVKVKYKVRTEKDRGHGMVRIVLDIRCPMKEDGDGSIPRVIMVLAKEGIPLRSDDGDMIWDSERPVNLDRGRAEISFQAAKEDADLKRMRLFFYDTDEYWHHKIVHPLYGRSAGNA